MNLNSRKCIRLIYKILRSLAASVAANVEITRKNKEASPASEPQLGLLSR